ncbi:hypothetical protein FB45DRAFT_792828 [Roridomyces roridus]|uniref:DUF1264-domain-containing protein n=1 Tax=Roridomyces roridus TaxID=1738132 RepID=A0AAD7BTL2_9AGAR|nr:hypothetical protein FB45DRAFT_792828 [Roridomyces roridus]
MSNCDVDAAAHAQDVGPVKNLCAFLNAFHVYASDTKRFVETNHYCSHVSEDFRQCILYDAPGPNARLIGVEYMITPRLFETLPVEEKHYWHSHVFEVKSGMLIMPQPAGASQSAWEAAETKEMVEVVKLYGKVYHLWQTDRGDALPLGPPQLMTSFTHEGQFDFDKYVGDRDKRFGVEHKRKQALRKDIEEPKVDKNADWAWKQ